jgi:excisionase family DNA binding protein
MKRFDLAPLAHFLGVELGRNGGHQPDQPTSGLAAIADHLNVSYSTAQRLQRHGLTDAQADRYAVAVAVGTLPELLWADWAVQLAQARLVGAAAASAAKATCPAGHPYDVVTPQGWRRCSRCRLSSVVASRRRVSHPAHCLQKETTPMPDEQLLTKREVARRWQVSTRTVERDVEAGPLVATRIGGAARFRLADVEHAEQQAATR